MFGKLYLTNESKLNQNKKNDLLGNTALLKTFSKWNTTNWSYKLYNDTEVNIVAIPSDKIDKLPARYHEALL